MHDADLVWGLANLHARVPKIGEASHSLKQLVLCMTLRQMLGQ